MYEIGDIVQFRPRVNEEYSGSWEITYIDRNDRLYDTIFYKFTIKNLETDEEKDELSWLQINLI